MVDSIRGRMLFKGGSCVTKFISHIPIHIPCCNKRSIYTISRSEFPFNTSYDDHSLCTKIFYSCILCLQLPSHCGKYRREIIPSFLDDSFGLIYISMHHLNPFVSLIPQSQLPLLPFDNTYRQNAVIHVFQFSHLVYCFPHNGGFV